MNTSCQQFWLKILFPNLVSKSPNWIICVNMLHVRVQQQLLQQLNTPSQRVFKQNKSLLRLLLYGIAYTVSHASFVDKVFFANDGWSLMMIIVLLLSFVRNFRCVIIPSKLLLHSVYSIKTKLLKNRVIQNRPKPKIKIIKTWTSVKIIILMKEKIWNDLFGI